MAYGRHPEGKGESAEIDMMHAMTAKVDVLTRAVERLAQQEQAHAKEAAATAEQHRGALVHLGLALQGLLDIFKKGLVWAE